MFQETKQKKHLKWTVQWKNYTKLQGILRNVDKREDEMKQEIYMQTCKKSDQTEKSTKGNCFRLIFRQKCNFRFFFQIFSNTIFFVSTSLNYLPNVQKMASWKHDIVCTLL